LSGHRWGTEVTRPPPNRSGGLAQHIAAADGWSKPPSSLQRFDEKAGGVNPDQALVDALLAQVKILQAKIADYPCRTCRKLSAELPRRRKRWYRGRPIHYRQLLSR